MIEEKVKVITYQKEVQPNEKFYVELNSFINNKKYRWKVLCKCDGLNIIYETNYGLKRKYTLKISPVKDKEIYKIIFWGEIYSEKIINIYKISLKNE